MMQYALITRDSSVRIMRLIARNTTIERELEKWPEHQRAEIVEWHPVDELPKTNEHREAWVWDGQKVAVDPSRIKPPAPVAAPAGAVIAQDPRVDALGPQLSEQIAAGFQAMRRELQTEIAVEHRRSIEALTVASALQEGKAIDPGSFPALERILRDAGRPVTSDEIIAAADEQARRSIELAGGL